MTRLLRVETLNTPNARGADPLPASCKNKKGHKATQQQSTDMAQKKNNEIKKNNKWTTNSGQKRQ